MYSADDKKAQCLRHQDREKSGLYDAVNDTYKVSCGDYRCPACTYAACKRQAAQKSLLIDPYESHFEFVIHFNELPSPARIQQFVSDLRNRLRSKRLPVRMDGMLHADPGDWHMHLSFKHVVDTTDGVLQSQVMYEMLAYKSYMWRCLLTPPQEHHNPVAWTWYVWRARPQDKGFDAAHLPPPEYQLPYWSQRPRRPLHQKLHQ